MYIKEIGWGTEDWIAEIPDCLIHYNGDRFLVPRRFVNDMRHEAVEQTMKGGGRAFRGTYRSTSSQVKVPH